MIVSIGAAALAVQLSMMPGSAVAPVLPQAVQYRVPAHPPPCGHGWDLSAHDGLCYPNGYLPPQDAGRKAISASLSRRPLPGAVGMARTSIAGTVNATRPERSRCSIRRGVNGITANGTTNARRRAGTTIGTEASGRLGWHPPNVRLPERYGRRSTATASATTATSEAMVYGFGSHPSGA